ncbi:g272 [Coccomyxa viridis]|uniref:G272 protein n=1 Tax=Coccomyxa viridis TaxID=1274662 RepID=A0ABP1FKH5_9CHLO
MHTPSAQDVGFDYGGKGGKDNQIIDVYFHHHFPKAINTSRAMRARGGPERYRYMTQSWLVSLFMDCPPNFGITCPSYEEVEAFTEAVHAGDIFWHAMPFNTQVELLDAPLLQYAVEMTHELDDRFGQPPKRTMSQRDVLGVTRGAVPILARSGVDALTVGCNGAGAPPGVPKNQPFLWRDEGTGTQIVAMWHAGGYSGTPVDSHTECVKADGFEHVLCAAWHLGDNSGPHDVQEALAIFDIVRSNWTDAAVFSSTFDNYTAALIDRLPYLNLPVFTEEIGDTWIYGVGSDVDKVAEYRAFARMRRAFPQSYTSYEMGNFSRFLIKVPEHTWGVDIKIYLDDYADWTNTELQRQIAAREPRFVYTVDAWIRQRSYTRWALEALDASLALNFWGVLEELDLGKTVPNLKGLGFSMLGSNDSLVFTSNTWNITLDPESGGLTSLQKLWVNGKVGTQWADPKNPLGRFVYSSYTQADYNNLFKTYMYIDPTEWWVSRDYGKYNVSSANPKRLDTSPTASEFWFKKEALGSFEVVVVTTMPQELVQYYGAPAQVWYNIRSPGEDDTLLMDILWVNKTATRLPEALWAQFKPDAAVVDPDSWTMSKMGSPISPLNVVLNGSQSLHAVDDEGIMVEGLGRQRSWEQLQIRTLDAALVSPGEATPFPVVDRKPDMSKGMTFNLGNNIWGTNYVMWQPYMPHSGNQRFRFEIRAHDLSTPHPSDLSSRPSTF